MFLHVKSVLEGRLWARDTADGVARAPTTWAQGDAELCHAPGD